MRSRLLPLAAIFLVGLLVAGVAWAQVSPNFDLSWHVVAGGGSNMTSANHQVRSTLGQFSIGPASSAGYRVGSGYWYGIRREVQPVGYTIYLPIVLKNAPR